MLPSQSYFIGHRKLIEVHMLRKLTILLLLSAAAPLRVVGQAPSPDYRSRTIYFLLTDRFYPHQPYDPYIDPLYPNATNSIDCFTQGCLQEEEFRKYWGGDLRGLEQRLNYIHRLGASAVWITPLAENVRMYEGGTGYGTGYHGYWVQNYYQVNKHFGDWSDVESLSAQLHVRRMRYIQDITLNDSNPLDNHVYGRVYNRDGSVFVRSYHDDFDRVYGGRFYKHYEQTPQCQQAKTIPDTQWTWWQLHHCLLADLSGWNQHDPLTAQYLIGAGKTWIDHGVDDFRLDAIKFVFPDFVSSFTHTMIGYLKELGRPDPYIVGEFSGGGVGYAKSVAFANNYDYFNTNILDFQLSFEINRFIGGSYEVDSELADAGDLNKLLQQRIAAFKGRDDWMGTFLENHDEIRTMTRLYVLHVPTETERRQRMDLGTVLLMTVRGIPIIYYGDEQYLAIYDAPGQTYNPKYVNSGSDDPWNRPGMKAWGSCTSAFRLISALAALRRNSPAIWRGSYRTVYAKDDVLIYERIAGDDMVLVAVNRGSETDAKLNRSLGFSPGLYRGVIAHASPANAGNYLKVTSRDATIHLGPLSSLAVAR
jgi:cyclomaltodextrin glucanotransferase